MTWLDHFAIAGELVRIEQVTKDPTAGLHRDELILRLTGKVQTPESDLLLIRASVENHLNQIKHMGNWHKVLFLKRFCPTYPVKWTNRFQADGEPIPDRVVAGGWEWRRTEEIWNEHLEAWTGGVWYRHDFKVLKAYEWGLLRDIGSSYVDCGKDPVKVRAGMMGGRPRKTA